MTQLQQTTEEGLKMADAGDETLLNALVLVLPDILEQTAKGVRVNNTKSARTHRLALELAVRLAKDQDERKPAPSPTPAPARAGFQQRMRASLRRALFSGSPPAAPEPIPASPPYDPSGLWSILPQYLPELAAQRKE